MELISPKPLNPNPTSSVQEITEKNASNWQMDQAAAWNPDEALNPVDFLGDADHALFETKRKGKMRRSPLRDKATPKRPLSIDRAALKGIGQHQASSPRSLLLSREEAMKNRVADSVAVHFH